MLLEGWALPVAGDVVDHAFVRVIGAAGRVLDAYGCWGRTGGPGEHKVCSNRGSWNWSNCYRGDWWEWAGTPDTARIGIYSVNGVCHQSANCFLISSERTLDARLVRGAAASYAIYGMYGNLLGAWYPTIYEPCTHSVPFVVKSEIESDTKNDPSGRDPLIDLVQRVHLTAKASIDPNTILVDEFRVLMDYYLGLGEDVGFGEPHLNFLRAKDSLTNRYVGPELAARLNESARELQVKLRDRIGPELYKTLMVVDDPSTTLDIVDPTLTDLAGVPPSQPVYDAWFVSQSVPTFMIADGRSYPVSIKMYNSGEQVWRPDRIWLRSENLPNNTTWGRNWVGLPHGANVEAKSDAIFSFDVTPQEFGEGLFRWGMFRQGVGPFGQKNEPVWVMVARDALFVRQSVPATIVAGTTQPVSVTFRNISVVTWTRGAGFRLGSQGPANNTIWGLNRVELPHDVPPDSDVKFDFSITAPAAAAKCNFQWQVLQEQVAWLGQPSPAFEVRVMPLLTKAAVFVTQTVANPIHPGAVQVVAVTMRNVGTATWTAAGQFNSDPGNLRTMSAGVPTGFPCRTMCPRTLR